jgi:hypothetical protein
MSFINDAQQVWVLRRKGFGNTKVQDLFHCSIGLRQPNRIMSALFLQSLCRQQLLSACCHMLPESGQFVQCVFGGSVGLYKLMSPVVITLVNNCQVS